MINKYAEIQDRIILYNACKGILRTKIADYNDPAFYPGLEDADPQDYTIEHLRENLLNAKNDAASAKINAMSNAGIAKNIAGNARKVTKGVGTIVGAGIGGGLGYSGATSLANYFKLLGKDKSLNRRRLGVTLQLAGLLGGGVAGGFGGNWLGNLASNKLYNTDGLAYTSPDDVLKK